MYFLSPMNSKKRKRKRHCFSMLNSVLVVLIFLIDKNKFYIAKLNINLMHAEHFLTLENML
jgi:hypothetical protein